MQSLKTTIKDTIHGDKHPETSVKGQTILVTGGSGFIAAHILNSFLSRGYNIRATIRGHSSADKVKKTHAKYVNQLSFVIVEDMTKPGAFYEAAKVVHAASPFPMEDGKDNVKELLDPAIKGTTGILEAIAKNNPTVKRVVVTSSFAAQWNGSKGNWPEHTYTEADWNPVTYDEAVVADADTAYCASKTFAERAAWDFVEEKKPNFTVSTICPPMVYGPPAHAPASVRELNTSSADIYRLTNGSESEVPETSFPAFVDVRDVGESHVLAYENAEPGRFFITGGSYTYQQVCDIINKDFPERRDLTPKGTPGKGPEGIYKVDNSKARKELGMTSRDLQTTIHDMVVELKEIEKRSGV